MTKKNKNLWRVLVCNYFIRRPKMPLQDESEEDKDLQDELRTLVDKIKGPDTKLISPALEMLKFLIRTSTTSMTSVPKPLKYLSVCYKLFKDVYEGIKDPKTKKQCADIISVLAMGPIGDDTVKEKRECLRYCLLGTMKNIGDWGHEYIRQLEGEIVEQWTVCSRSGDVLMPLIKDIIEFDCKHHAEIQACDMLMEIDKLELLSHHIDESTYQRVCLYLASCVKYVENIEATKILKIVTDQYIRFDENTRALITAIQMNDRKLVSHLFSNCKDQILLKQMAFIAARQLYLVDLDANIVDREEILSILGNCNLNTHFQTLVRELDIMEPKSPEEVYKCWLEPVPLRPKILGENMDSAHQNLAASFVNGFVNAGFGCDKLITPEGGNKWIYRNKEHGMISATASLGLLHLWDVDGGLTPIDKYLYSNDKHIKAGALLALGLVNCRIRNDCDPALALLSDFVTNTDTTLQAGAIFGLGLAYAGTNRPDVLSLLLPAVDNALDTESLAIASLSCGLISVGTCNANVSSSILSKIVDSKDSEVLKSPYMQLVVLGLGMCYMGCKDAIEATSATLEIFTEPFKTISQCLLKMCAYAGTGDVLIIQELLHTVSERIELPDDKLKSAQSSEIKVSFMSEKEKRKGKREWDAGMAQAVAAVAVAAVAIGEDTGTEMCQRILGQMGRYGDLSVRRAIPLSVALTSVSRPHLQIIDILTKYAHDTDEEVSCNAIFCLGVVGAGTNNARLSANLRQLAVYHMRNSSQLFMVRLAQGLTHLGKGTLTISPLHTDRQLLDSCAMAGLLIPLISLLNVHTIILGHSHYLLYALAAAMHPRWLLTLDEELQPVSVSVRVGQAVDTVGKAGTPKTIAGIHTHTTPVLLAAGERAELTTNEYEQLCPTLDGICILKKKS